MPEDDVKTAMKFLFRDFLRARRFIAPGFVFLCWCAILQFRAEADPALATAIGRPPQAPPPAPPIVVGNPHPLGLPPQPPDGSTPYSIGQPTDEEQLYLEYLNRARANPPAEGARLAGTTDPEVLSAYAYFNVDLALLQSQFDAIAPAPPVAMNPQLTTAARLHSEDMLVNNYQGHVESNGSNPGDRITAQGYPWHTYGENVYASAKSVFYGHAGFEVDWGPGTGGMQTPPGHRENIHNSAFREVGVGVVNGTNTSVGPQLVTEDFATKQSDVPFITGVVYYDLNTNGFYDIGEGIGGVTVQVPGSTYFAVTADSGGYAVPVSSNGTYDVTFSASGLNFPTTATVITQANVKVDFVPAYLPPVVSGPNPASLNVANTYTFTTVGAATNYQWEQTQVVPYTTIEGAENGTANVTTDTSSGYSVIITDRVNSGTHAFHLAQPDGTSQYLTLNPVLLLNANSELSFAKRLGYATPTQIARAQISTDGGTTWQDVWSEAGSGTSGDASYSTIHVPLGSYAGETVQIRFAFEISTGSYYTDVTSNVGLCLDDIAVSNADEIQTLVVNDIPSGNSFVFSPTASGDYLLRVRAQLPGRTLPWGPITRISTTTSLPPMQIQFTGAPLRIGNQFQADFTVQNFQSGASFQLLSAPSLSATWTPDTSASFQTLVAGSRFRVITTNAAGMAFYRIAVND